MDCQDWTEVKIGGGKVSYDLIKKYYSSIYQKRKSTWNKII